MDYNTVIANRYNSNVFFNSPSLKAPESISVVKNLYINETIPFFSIVIPIHNQQDIITRTVKGIFDNTTEKHYEILLLLDSCSDDTENKLLEFIDSITLPNLLVNFVVIRSDTPLFETMCDNILFLCSRGDFIIEVQADIEITTPGYNMKLQLPFKIRKDILMVSGRACLNLFDYSKAIGKIGNYNELPLSKDIALDKFYIGEICIRGPVVIDKKKLIELKYLDEVNFYLGDDDVNICIRAYNEFNYIVGYVPIEYNSPLYWGSTRKQMNEDNKKFFEHLKKVCKKDMNDVINKYKLLNPVPREIYNINL